MRKVTPAALALSAWLTGAQAQDAEPPPELNLEFLEYLGAWAEDDDEWLAIEEWQKDEAAAPNEDRKRAERREEDDDEDD